MRIIFIGTVCSREKYKEIFSSRTKKFIDPAQKFLEQLIRGIAQNKEVKIVSINALPVSASTINQKVFPYSEEIRDNVNYIYPFFINGKLLRYISGFFSTFYTVKKQLKSKNKDKTIIITDPLSFHTSIAARLAGKTFKTKSIAIITDIPMYATVIKNHGYSNIRNTIQNIYESFTMKEIYKYDAYINLTEYMNKLVNPQKKPSIVIEGSIDSEISIDSVQNKTGKKIFLYAGGLYEKYGLNNLVEAFIMAKLDGVQLHLYGSGSYVEKLKKICKYHDSVIYKGCVLNTELIEIEKKADLLINPRFSNEEYTKLSFPSKTLEYMTTGTPVLSTRLPGIPKEYDDFIYWFNGESVNDMKNRLIEISQISINELRQKGESAKKFVFKNKTNFIQGKKIVEFSSKVLKSDGVLQ